MMAATNGWRTTSSVVIQAMPTCGTSPRIRRAWAKPDIWRFGRSVCVGSPVIAGGLVIAGDGRGSKGRVFAAVRPGEGGKAATVAYTLEAPVPLVPILLKY